LATNTEYSGKLLLREEGNNSKQYNDLKTSASNTKHYSASPFAAVRRETLIYVRFTEIA